MFEALMPRYTRRQWWAAVALFLATFVSAEIAHELYTVSAILSPTMGITLAILTLEGELLWPAVMLGFIAMYAFNGSNLPSLFLLTAANTIAPVFGAFLLRRFNFSPLF